MDTRRVIRCARLADRCRLRPVFGILLPLSLILLAGPRVRAETPCPIPDAMALHDISLPAARNEVATEQHLTVLTFGGVQPAGADAAGKTATWPARLQATLAGALPEIQVTVANEPPPGRTSADVPAALPGLVAKTGARLVIWGPGMRDVAARLDLETFRTAVNRGIEAARHSGADLILLDTTFVPSPAKMVLTEPYRDRLLAVASANQVPVLRRHGLMRLWQEDGTLNLAARDPAEREAVARHLFSCVSQGLAGAIAAAVR